MSREDRPVEAAPLDIPFTPRGLNQVAQSVVLLARVVQALRDELDARPKREESV